MQSYRSGIILASTSFFIIAMPLPEGKAIWWLLAGTDPGPAESHYPQEMAGLGDEARGLSQLSMD
jgi:hypothetical protein